MPQRSPLSPIFDPGKRRGRITTGAMIGDTWIPHISATASPGVVTIPVQVLTPLVASETLFVNAAIEAGVTTARTYNNASIHITGTGTFFSGAITDGETGSGSLSGHIGCFCIAIGAGPFLHVEPVGGPYTVAQPGGYTFLINAGGGTFRMRFQDSFWTDNTGGFTAVVTALP